MKKYTKEDWKKTGLLVNFLDERKDYVVETLNNVVDFLSTVSLNTLTITRESDGITLSNEDLKAVETVIISIVVKTLHYVDLTIEDIKNMYNHLIFDYTEKFARDASKHMNDIDFEAEYTFEYSENLVKLIQSKNK